ncbi:MAP3K epsilon protein kinase 1 isoform X2 [Cryptomeria japonica]|nr:MAP3K epsilon protein kinase 1 isoform X2 [Cryptomeria japonica]
MQEIDLLKNLNHKNIVKYQGSFKANTYLYIILEYVESGSLANMVKPNKFGAFPESLVAVYISQVLEGLVYLHEQGVIHRDIKGANILTTKQGLVKLADFGVATKLSEADHNTHSVVGTPYWMAPEVIEMSGVCAASDIWSVGCTVIELLTCVPPYYDLQPMPALFRIVQDEHPPIPEHLSPDITDFLHQCFRKDAKLRPDANTLLKHSWIQNSRSSFQSSLQRTGGQIRGIPEDVSTTVERTIEEGEKEKINGEEFERDHFELRFTNDPEVCSPTRVAGYIETVNNESSHLGSNRTSFEIVNPALNIEENKKDQTSVQGETLAADGIGGPGEEPLEHLAEPFKPATSSNACNNEMRFNTDNNSNEGCMIKPQENGQVFSVSGRVETAPNYEKGRIPNERDTVSQNQNSMEHKSQIIKSNDSPHSSQAWKKLASPPVQELSKYHDTPADGTLEEVFEEPPDTYQSSEVEDTFTSTVASDSHDNLGISNVDVSGRNKLSTKQKRMDSKTGKKNGSDLFSLMINIVEEDNTGDGGLQFEETVPRRDIFPKQAIEVSKLVSMLKPMESEEKIVLACQKLLAIFQDYPDQKSIFVRQHGVMPLMEMFELKNNLVTYPVLQVVNMLIRDNSPLQVNACLIGFIPVIMNLAGPGHSKEMRMQAAYSVQQLCLTSSLTLQMFIACNGLPVLVGFLEHDFTKYRDIVYLAIDCIWQVFKLHSSTPVNEFCQIFAKNGVLFRLVNTLHSLNEASRLDSVAGSGLAVSMTGKAKQGAYSDLIESSLPSFGHTKINRPQSSQLNPSKVQSGQTNLQFESSEAEASSMKSNLQLQKSSASQEDAHYSLGQTGKIHSLAGKSEPVMLSNSSEPASSQSIDNSMGNKEQSVLMPKEQKQFNFEHHESNDQNAKQLTQFHSHAPSGVDNTLNLPFNQNGQAQPLLAALEKEPPNRPITGPFEYIRYLSGGLERPENSIPLPHHSNSGRKTNGKSDLLMESSADDGKQREAIEFNSKSLPKAVASTSGLISQSASGLLSGSGILNAIPGSVTSSGSLSQMSLSTDRTREYLGKVAGLLLEFSQAGTVVKSFMSNISLLVRLFQMLNKLEPSILVKILKCINKLSTDPNSLEHLQHADAMNHLIPFLEQHDGSLVSQIHVEVLNTLYNLCKINKRRQEQAAENGIIPHLMHFIITDCPLKQVALPLLCDMAHASRSAREKLRVHDALSVYLSLLDDEAWAVPAFDSLTVCLAYDNEHRKVEQAFLKREAVQKLVSFFQRCSEQSFVHILEPFLKIIIKSTHINTELATNGLTPLLIARLDHQDAIVRLNLLKLIKAIYEHHPRPKQLILENDLPLKLQKLIAERKEGEHSGGQVLVKQMATSLLKALHINTVL